MRKSEKSENPKSIDFDALSGAIWRSDAKVGMQSNFLDPRRCADFLPQFYPSANGKEAPSADGADQNDRIVLEFLAAYYRLNREYSRLLEVRKLPASAQRNEAERQCLQDVEQVVIVRDGLEDRYASFGVIAEPIVRGGFTINVKISF